MRDRDLVLVSRSMPPDIGGYQRQFTLLGPALSQHYASLAWIGSTKDRPIRRARTPLPGCRLIRFPAHRIPRRVRGLSDVVVVVTASLWLATLRLRGRRGTLLVLSPTMLLSPVLARVASALDWRVAVRFPSRGDQAHRRSAAISRLTGGRCIVPSQGLVGEQEVFEVLPVPNAVGGCDPSPQDDGGEKTFLYLGRMVSGKRPDLVVAAWASIADRLPDWRLLLVGQGGSQRDSIEDELRAVVGSGRVARCELRAAVRDPGPVIAAADVFVFPSLSEGLPNSMLEALAAGVPTLADAELARDWFGRDVPLLRWDGCADTLAEAMLAAAHDVKARTDVGDASRRFAGEHHDPARIAARLVEVLEVDGSNVGGVSESS